MTRNWEAVFQSGQDFSPLVIAYMLEIEAIIAAGQVGGVTSVAATDGSVVVSGTATAPTVATGTLDAIATAQPPAGNVAMNGKKITGLANGTNPTDAATFGQISAGTGTVTSVASGDTSLVVTNPTTTPSIQVAAMNTLFTNSPPSASVAMNAKKITGLGLASASTDAASLANTLDQFGAPAANVSLNSHKITSLTNGASAQDAAAFGQIPTSASSIGGMLTATYDAAAIAQQVVGTTATQTLTNKTLTTPVIASILNSGTVTVPTGSDTLVARATTDTMTNKRVTKRTGTTASSATPTINTDNVDFYSITALAAAITSMTSNLSGTPTEAQTLWLAITDNGTARAITWGTSFEASGTIALPTTTVLSVRLDVGFVWNTVTSKWRCVAVA